MEEIIADLAGLLKDGRLIPFIGAGFSEGCGCPTGAALTQRLIRHLHNDPAVAGGGEVDLLHLAEYLSITNGGRIDEVIRQIQSILHDDCTDISASEPHLLLARLGVPIIYTTNYDCLIEKGFDYLKIPYQTVVTTEDIIKTIGRDSTQIIKFHGSLEQPESLVLTESDYFERLEFVTPIDLKLRGDALGKSLLFMGYSFSDFNVRYLWFKLRKMMQGVDSGSVPQSYILLFNPDQISAALLKNSGIIPIDLSVYDGTDRTARLTSFLRRLVFKPQK